MNRLELAELTSGAGALVLGVGIDLYRTARPGCERPFTPNARVAEPQAEAAKLGHYSRDRRPLNFHDARK